MVTIRRFLPVAILAFCLALGNGRAVAQEQEKAGGGEQPDAGIATAPVVVDGVTLLRLRGAGAYTAERRADTVAQRIVDAAKNPSFDPADLRIDETDHESRIMAGPTPLVRLFDPDGAVESVDRRALAQVALPIIQNEIVAWRAARTRAALVGAAERSGVALLLAVLAGVVVLLLARWGERRLESRLRRRIQSLAIQSFEFLRAERLWRLVRDLGRLVAGIVLVVIGYLFLHYALAQFPWTRGASVQLGIWMRAPLQLLGGALVAALPDLIILVVVYLLTRWILRLLRLFFDAIGRGDVTFSGFDSEWSDPTYKLVRIAVAALALVVAYPYIPGSSSEAFKGISLFFGVLLSLGASSIISNIMAGFTMTYRRAFHVGDMIKVGDVVGRVTSMRLVVTHLRTLKNEEIVVPNSKILADEIVNYSTLAREHGLILHTTVGIGYETPWRQVEAMLLEAARRTPGLAPQPPPFVLQKSLGDFAVTYEINVPCGDPPQMSRLYSALHRQILDVFNEYGVQIMTPAYEGDPEKPKVVSNEDWYREPAVVTPPVPERAEPQSGAA